nr:hypothetical protein [Paraburkholderia sp. HP33-1]
MPTPYTSDILAFSPPLIVDEAQIEEIFEDRGGGVVGDGVGGEQRGGHCVRALHSSTIGTSLHEQRAGKSRHKKADSRGSAFRSPSVLNRWFWFYFKGIKLYKQFSA